MVQDGPRVLRAHPWLQPWSCCQPRARSRPQGAGPTAASAPPSRRAEARECRVGAVQAVQPVTNPWSYPSLVSPVVSPVFVSAGRGPALLAGYCGYGWGGLAMAPSLLLQQLPACWAHRDSVSPRGVGGLCGQRSSPHGTGNRCGLVAKPCPSYPADQTSPHASVSPERKLLRPAPGAPGF